MSALGHNAFQTSGRWTLLKGLSAALLYWLLCLAVLCLVYPIGDRTRWFLNPLSRVLTEYLLMSFLVMCTVVLVVPLLTWWCNRLVTWLSIIVRTLTTFVILFLLAGYVGNSDDLEQVWPTSQIQSFFSELRVLIFLYEYTPIVSVLAGVYYWWIGRRKAVIPPSPERYATRGQTRKRSTDYTDDADPQISQMTQMKRNQKGTEGQQ